MSVQTSRGAAPGARAAAAECAAYLVAAHSRVWLTALRWVRLERLPHVSTTARTMSPQALALSKHHCRVRSLRICCLPSAQRVRCCGYLLALLLGALPAASWAISTQLSGMTGPAATNVINYLKTIDIPNDARPDAYRRRINAAIVKALKAYGYYAAEITITSLTQRQVAVNIVPGEPVTVRGLNIELLGEADRDDVFSALVKGSALVADKGKPLSHYNYETLKTALSTLAAQRGYFDAHYTLSRIEVRPWEQRADIVLVFDGGKRYTYGDIRYRGVQIDRHKIEAMRPFKSGDYYLADDLSRYNQRLSDAGWFRSIAIKPELKAPASADSDVVEVASPKIAGRQAAAQAAVNAAAGGHERALDHRGSADIDVTVTPADRHRFETSVGFSTDEGPRTRLSWNQPWTNTAGDSWNNSLYLSSKKQILSGLYSIPLANPLRDRYDLEYGIKRINDSDTNSVRKYFTPARVWRFGNGWEQRLYVTFASERFTQADDADTVYMTMPGMAWTRTQVDHVRFPMQGNKQTLSVEAASHQLLSDVTFLRAEASTQWITHLGHDNRFFGRLLGGTTVTDDFHRLPPSLRFFAGGDSSIRGYAYNDVAPRNAQGSLIGGQHLAVGTLEYQRRVAGNWWAAMFYDAGSVWETTWTAEDVKRAAGVGVRWQSIVGPIRLDVAHPFDSKEDSWRLHFAIGPEF